MVGPSGRYVALGMGGIIYKGLECAALKTACSVYQSDAQAFEQDKAQKEARSSFSLTCVRPTLLPLGSDVRPGDWVKCDFMFQRGMPLSI